MKVKLSKFQIECVLHELANKKNMNNFKFRKIGGFIGVLNNRVSEKNTSDFKNWIFRHFLMN